MDKSKKEVRILGKLIGYCSKEEFDIELIQYIYFEPLESVNLKSGYCLSYYPIDGQIDIYNNKSECIQSAVIQMTDFLIK
ncbi:hypothetical protein UFOVP459_37 [uncultured Caudovirales phage]|uniref:Uncharacterized protein n=1 Tax=uncultured Caudovirales phage TaxID=2100421 RepID=A0A6J5QRA7_9CAUD|nr:hypothetical protein UFOVP459_37 [uncultured Caudovirales phage]CAB4183275.1 hypothetical protein UFOVP1089_48 [uncultured Caudovirales phage]CAB4213078.1 hypothetical protein UFOVP1443_67 [uncultured Caudovirales phage]